MLIGCSVRILEYVEILGAHFNLEIRMLEQLKGRTFKILKNKNFENYKLENQNLEKQKS
jgi:hypothetical protein